MTRRSHRLLVAALSALGLLVLAWTGGPAGSSVRFGPLEWRSSREAPETEPLAERLEPGGELGSVLPKPGTADASEPVS